MAQDPAECTRSERIPGTPWASDSRTALGIPSDREVDIKPSAASRYLSTLFTCPLNIILLLCDARIHDSWRGPSPNRQRTISLLVWSKLKVLIAISGIFRGMNGPDQTNNFPLAGKPNSIRSLSFSSFFDVLLSDV